MPEKIAISGNPMKWLTSIISSPLSWIPDEVARDQVWERASSRLSERWGRTALPAMTRKFRILAGEQEGDQGLQEKIIIAPSGNGDGLFQERIVEVALHEPTMDGDNLGHK